MRPKVSVIVPVYRVEPYLKCCLDSLNRQSLTDIEILLIDDASPDRCGEICEAYAMRDQRFKVFHLSENGGLSVARNRGIKEASGKYLMFVDSDDWVHNDFCQEAYECAETTQSDLVMFNFIRIKNNRFNGKHQTKVFKSFCEGNKSREESLAIMLEDVGNAVWNKLYKRELFEGINFPEGLLYEDTGTTYRLVFRSYNTYYLDKALYYYCERPRSITTIKNLKVLNDRARQNVQRYRDLIAWGYDSEMLDYRIKVFALWYLLRKNKDFSDSDYCFLYNLLQTSHDVPRRFSNIQKIQWQLFKYTPSLFILCPSLYKCYSILCD